MELKRIGPKIVDLKRSNKVGSSLQQAIPTTIEFMKFCDTVNYRTILNQMYGALYRQNVGVDFIFPESTNLLLLQSGSWCLRCTLPATKC